MDRTALKDLNELDVRKAEILKTVIDIYLADPTPVASKMVGAKSDLGVSSATIRSEMHALEEEGYLAQTHTSSGRIPTDRGYRFFVDNFVAKQNKRDNALVRKSTQQINEKLETMGSSSPTLLDDIVVLLSTITQHTAVALRSAVKKSSISDIHVSALSKSRLVLGIFFEDTTIDRVVIDLDQFSSGARKQIGQFSEQTYVNECERVLRTQLIGKQLTNLGSADQGHQVLKGFEAELLTLVLQGCSTSSSNAGSDSFIHVAGVSKIADVNDNADKVLGLVEQHLKFVEVIRNSLSETINARIGSENNLEELQRHSMILAPIHGLEGESGAVGIIGPTRMDYFKAFDCISAASEVAGKYMDQ